MLTGPPTASPTEIRAVRRSLTAANDAKVRQVVAMLDSMTERGPADALIAPMRDRLAHLRPARKLRFERLLFMPLDPLIVPPQEWRPKDPTIPRNAVGPIAGTIRIALGRDLRAINATIAGKTTLDADAVLKAGALLWPITARILSMAPMPMGWTEAGLKASAYAPLARAIAAVLSRLPILQTLIQDANNGMIAPSEEAIEAIVADLPAEPPEVQTMVIALLLTRLPQAGPLLQRIESAARNKTDRGALRLAGEQAADALLDRLEAEGGTEAQVIATQLVDAGPEIRRLTALLHELDSRSASPERRARLKVIRQRLDTSCRARFASGLTDELLAPLQASPGAVDREMQLQLEATARQLRALETTARKVGSAGHYDEMLREASTAVRSNGSGVLSVARAARLVEILAGSEAAMAVLEDQQ